MPSQSLVPPRVLSEALQAIIPRAQLQCQSLPNLPAQRPLQLWLIEDCFSHTQLNDEVVSKIWQNTPYWIFCWASGLAMAQWLLNEPEHVKDKTVLDFGAGSGVVGIAAKRAGAKRVICCDIDAISLAACHANAVLNQVELDYLEDLYSLDHKVDILLAADVLYDQANRFLLDDFLKCADQIWVADSRVRDFKHDRYKQVMRCAATTVPDLDESEEFNQVNFYKSI